MYPNGLIAEALAAIARREVHVFGKDEVVEFESH